jgi:hypothetical protein
MKDIISDFIPFAVVILILFTKDLFHFNCHSNVLGADGMDMLGLTRVWVNFFHGGGCGVYSMKFTVTVIYLWRTVVTSLSDFIFRLWLLLLLGTADLPHWTTTWQETLWKIFISVPRNTNQEWLGWWHHWGWFVVSFSYWGKNLQRLLTNQSKKTD